jgi:hypothetical protein
MEDGEEGSGVDPVVGLFWDFGFGLGLGARGGAATGKYLPLAATRTSPVTQTGVWWARLWEIEPPGLAYR